MVPRFSAIFALFALCGCDPRGSSPAPFPGDWTPPEGPWAYEGPERLITFEADDAFEAGTYAVWDPEGRAWVAQGGRAHSDAIAACAGPWLLVINRMFGDNLQFVDPEDGATVGQYSVGNGLNPAAAAFVGERVFVALYEADYLAVLRWDTGEELGRVDLAPWADGDGVPEQSQLFLHDGLLWLTLQRLGREAAWWVVEEQGVLLGVDPESLEVVAEVPLGLGNLTGRWSLRDGLARAAAVGAYFTDASQEEILLDGGLVEVDLSARQARALALDEAVAGANVYDAVVDGTDAWLSADEGWGDGRYEAWALDGPERLGVLFEGYTPAWTWEDPADPAAGVWLARRSEQALELRAWPSGEILQTVPTALPPDALERCRPGY